MAGVALWASLSDGEGGVQKEHALLGIGLMLSSSEITRIAGAFGLDTSTRANIMSAVYTAQTAVHTGKAIVQAVSK